MINSKVALMIAGAGILVAVIAYTTLLPGGSIRMEDQSTPIDTDVQPETSRTVVDDRVVAAQLRLEQTSEAVQTAEAAYQRIESEIESMNLLIVDLEYRGEDLLAHQDEILDGFEPLLAELLDAQVRMEAAIEAELDAAAILEAISRSADRNDLP